MRADFDEAILRVLAGDSDAVEARRVAGWRDEAPENESYFRDVEAIWEASALLAWRVGVPEVPSADVIARRGASLERRQIRGRFARAVRRREIWPLAAAVLIAAAGIGVWAGRASFDDPPRAEVEYVSGAASTTAALPDGSIARLAPGARLRVAQTDNERTARLSGRAFFAIASDPELPFTVQTERARVVVMGTRFEVASDGDALRVILVEGRVALETDAGHAVTMEPGQVARLTEGGDFSVRSYPDLSPLLDWPGGLLLFQSTPLRMVGEEMSAHFGVPVVVDEALADRTVTAWFEGEPLAEVAESICLLVQGRCTVDPSEVRIER
ncbi:MAG: FecR domain-containing protein [Gemmatimonadota bacterium]